MPQLKTRLLLALSGLVLLGVGIAVLFDPVSFFAGNGIALTDNPSLLSEIRAPGTLLLVTGSLILVSAWRAVAMPTALGLATLVYAAYGIGRVLSLFWDGLPSSGLIGAATIELLLAGLNGAVWLHHRLERVSGSELGVDPMVGLRPRT